MSEFSKPKQIVGLIVSFVVCFAVSAVGAAASFQAQAVYGKFEQPAWAPPGWLFGPVWTLLFSMMAVAAWLVWRRGGFEAQRVALSVFAVQLVLNGLWSWLFFAWRMGGWAFAEILLLFGAIAWTIVVFRRVNGVAAGLLVPYWLWVGFASVLNYVLWQMNPGLLGG